mmetsp:Transcript_81127/g.160790  ORF Transcript_81127/g.160790 Transcript_81127/m.160790 type:complete len:119 (-) Transcript_81127:470-826(-)
MTQATVIPVDTTLPPPPREEKIPATAPRNTITVPRSRLWSPAPRTPAQTSSESAAESVASLKTICTIPRPSTLAAMVRRKAGSVQIPASHGPDVRGTAFHEANGTKNAHDMNKDTMVT